MSTKGQIQPRLGRGLASIITPDLGVENQPPPQAATPPQAIQPQGHVAPQTSRLATLRIDQVRKNPFQPRKSFDEAAIDSLAASLKARGALQPIVVRPAEGGYELVAGERRLRAAERAGLVEMPAIVRSVRDDEMLELALIENLQRSDLNPVDRARAYKTMQERGRLSHDQIAERVGDDRATVTNYLRLLALPSAVLDMLVAGSLGTGHAKAILGVENSQLQTSIADRVVRDGLSVRQVEAIVAKLRPGAKANDSPPEKPTRPAVVDLERKLTGSLGTKVQIREGRKRHTGRIVIEYYTLDDFERVVTRLGMAAETP